MGQQGDYSSKAPAMLERKDVAAALEMIAKMATKFLKESGIAETREEACLPHFSLGRYERLL